MIAKRINEDKTAPCSARNLHKSLNNDEEEVEQEDMKSTESLTNKLNKKVHTKLN